MTQHLPSCPVCGAQFAGRRSDAIYCSAACQQKAHRRRTADRITALLGTQRTPALGDTATLIQCARQQIARSQALCRAAAERVQESAALQQQHFGKRAGCVAAPDTTFCHVHVS